MEAYRGSDRITAEERQEAEEAEKTRTMAVEVADEVEGERKIAGKKKVKLDTERDV